MSHTPKRVGVFLSRLSGYHLRSPCDPQQLQACSDVWRECVGEMVASHVVPVLFVHGCLTLHADSSLWLHKLLHQRPALIRRLRQRAPLRDLADLQVRVVPRGLRQTVAAKRAITPSSLARSVIAHTAEGIDDPGLRAALERLAGRPSKTSS